VDRRHAEVDPELDDIALGGQSLLETVTSGLPITLQCPPDPESVPLIGRPAEAVVIPSAHTYCHLALESRTSALHQEHIILHEVAHLLCEHQPVISHHEIGGLLCPDLERHVIERVLGRTCYATWAEQEAELIASLILTKAERHPDEVACAIAPDVAPVVARVARSLGHR
jgi:hypothetical protein